MKHNPYLKNFKAAVFDIETTGLIPSRDIVINSGFYDMQEKTVFQNFTPSPSLESVSVEEIYERIRKYDAIITYNGDSFDLPFMSQRAKKYGIDDNLKDVWYIDLYRWLKKYWPGAAMMKSLTQKSVEEAFGLGNKRFDDPGSAACVPLYNLYLQTGDENARKSILLHNAYDVEQLGKIADMCSFLPYHEIAFNEGFMVKTEDGTKVKIKIDSFKRGMITASAKSSKFLMPAAIFEDDYSFEYDSFSGRGELKLRLNEKEPYIYTDLKKLGIDMKEFENMPELKSGYLVLCDKGVYAYEAINKLVSSLIIKFF